MHASKDELNSAAEALWQDSGNPENQKRALEIFHRLYDLGDKVRAGYRLGIAYYLGRGAPKDAEMAYRFLSLPELDQKSYALYYRGLVLKDPSFSGRDDRRAMETLQLARDLGVEQAAAHLTENLIVRNDRTVATRVAEAPATARKAAICTVCGHDLSALPKSELNCPQCNAPPRTRVFVDFMAEMVKPLVERAGGFDKPLLAFAMTDGEQKILSSCFDIFKSVSLYGNYRRGHEEGVDARDLSRYADSSFCAHFGILLFDYFPEHEKALAEAARVTADGGIFFHHMNTARLVSGGQAPKIAYTVQKRPGYFDYVPDAAAMPSIRVGIDWFVAAMERAGFDARHISMNDRHTGEAVHWFLGVKRASGRAEAPASTTFQVAPAKAEPLDLSTATNKVDKYECVGEKVYRTGPKTYSVPVFDLDGVDRIVLDISIPPIPESLKNCDFAEHVFDAEKGEATDQVIIAGVGRIGVSDDLGLTWKRIEPRGFEKIRFQSCFTTRSGKHIVQAIGWQGINDTNRPELHHGQIFVFSPDWTLIGTSKAGSAQWHGSASIAEKNGIVMYAEYHGNTAQYRPDYANSGLQHTVLPNAIWRSKDEGLSWEKVFERDPTQIRHFHTLMADPFEKDTWWASSGDQARECFVWKSVDNGDTWVDFSDPELNISATPSFSAYKKAAHRYTDAIILKDQILWGADDLMGIIGEYTPTRALEQRAGSRIYCSPKTEPLHIKEIAYIGPAVRNIIDIERGYLITTEAKYEYTGRRPGIFFLTKDLKNCIEICRLDNFRNRPTGFTFSRASRGSKGGRFFSYRGIYDAFENDCRICQFDIRYIKDN